MLNMGCATWGSCLSDTPVGLCVVGGGLLVDVALPPGLLLFGVGVAAVGGRCLGGSGCRGLGN